MSPSLILYELVSSTDENARNFSAPVWKTKVDLAILDVPHTCTGRSFHRIRTELSKTTGNPTVTVPTLDCDGEHITDSWVIAEYLEEKYAKPGKSLFPSSEGRRFAKFIDVWGNMTLGAELRALILPRVYAHIDEPSAEYFLRTRFSSDHASMDRMTSSLSDPTFVSAQCAAARTRLQVVESLLKDNKGGFLMGDEPTHADACLFGWYAFSRLNGDVVKGVWEHESLPMVGEWVERLVQRLVKREELF